MIGNLNKVNDQCLLAVVTYLLRVKRFAISENMKLVENKKEFGLHSFEKNK